MTIVAGIDLSGPANPEETALAVLESRESTEWRVVDWSVGATDAELMEILGEVAGGRDRPEMVVGLDAPLSYSDGGGLRRGDRALRETLRDRGFPAESVLPPTMTRMAYLSLRGIAVARLLESEFGARPVEVHPTSALYFRAKDGADVRAMKESGAARRRLVESLELRSAPVEPTTRSHHLLAACAAARAAADWLADDPAWQFASDPPHHPYPIVC